MPLSQLVLLMSLCFFLNKSDSMCFTGRAERVHKFPLLVVLFVIVFVARAGALIPSTLGISTWTGRGTFAPGILPTHMAMCERVVSKMREGVSEVSRKRRTGIAVLLKLFFSIFWTFPSASSANQHQQKDGITSAWENWTREDAFYVASGLNFYSFGLLLPK